MSNSPESQAEALSPMSNFSQMERPETRHTFQKNLSKARTVIGRIGLTVGLSIGSFAALESSSMEVLGLRNTALADAGGYPWPNAPCIHTGKVDGPCLDYDWAVNGNTLDSRGYGYRNCTSYAAWRVIKEFGINVKGWGHAATWDDNARKAGYAVDVSSPEPGDLAVWDTTYYGHVAFVESVNSNGSVNIAEYNRAMLGEPGVRRGVVANHYIDINGEGKIWGGSVQNSPTPTPPESKKPINGDYNGDKITDLAVYRPSDRIWHIKGVGDFQWGEPGDIPVPADYNGDKKTDIAVYRPRNGGWYIRGIGIFSFGWNGDIPVPGDYNGDGDAEIAVYRPSTGNWHIREVGDFQWGRPGDIPVAGYYNNDDKLDIAIYRPENGGWYIRNIADIPYGWSGDIPVPADYTGDGITDLAIYRPIDGGWRVRGVGDFSHGWSTDVPVTGRYNSDAYADAAIYRPDDGGWRIRAVGDFPYGWSTDIPVVQTLNASLLKRYGLLPNY